MHQTRFLIIPCRFTPGLRRRSVDPGAGGEVGALIDGFDAEVVEEDLALPPGAGGHHEHERLDVPDFAAARRAPSEGHLAPADVLRGPLRWISDIQFPGQPGVLLRVDQLKLEVINRGIRPQIKGELVVLGQIDREILPRADVAVRPAQIELHDHGFAGFPLGGGQVHRGALRMNGLPSGQGLKVVEQAGLLPKEPGQHQPGDDEKHPRAPVIRSVWRKVHLPGSSVTSVKRFGCAISPAEDPG